MQRGERELKELMSSAGIASRGWGGGLGIAPEVGAAEGFFAMCCGLKQRHTPVIRSAPTYKGSCTECYTWADLQRKIFISQGRFDFRDHMLACLFSEEPRSHEGKIQFYWLSEKRELEMLAK